MAAMMNPVLRQLIDALENEEFPPSLDQIQAIASADPLVLQSKFTYRHYDGFTPLHLALRNNHMDDQILHYLLDHWTDRYIPASGGELPIHVACGSARLHVTKRLLSTIQKMVQLHPESLQMEGTLGLPLHYAALSKNSNVDTVKFLVDQCPKAIHERASFNKDLPIHMAIRSKSEASFSVVQFLAKADPRTLLTGGEETELPIHTACYTGASLDVVDFLVSRCPSSLQMKDQDGDLPLASACHGRASVQVLDYLLERKGNLQVDHLLHECYGKENIKDLEFVQFLIKGVPACLVAKNSQGELPLHKVLRVMGILNMNDKHRHVELLARAYPASLFIQSNAGMTPLDVLLRVRSYHSLDQTRHFLEEEMKTILGGLLKDVADKFGAPEDALRQHVLPYCV